MTNNETPCRQWLQLGQNLGWSGAESFFPMFQLGYRLGFDKTQLELIFFQYFCSGVGEAIFFNVLAKLDLNLTKFGSQAILPMCLLTWAWAVTVALRTCVG